MDAGPVVKMIERPLGGDEKSSKILSEMFQVGTKELISALPSLWDGTMKKYDQVESEATHAPKINSTEARYCIDRYDINADLCVRIYFEICVCFIELILRR
jgi:methionyl-tRNA formyltransferase